jgi:hypothetical protein
MQTCRAWRCASSSADWRRWIANWSRFGWCSALDSFGATRWIEVAHARGVRYRWYTTPPFTTAAISVVFRISGDGVSRSTTSRDYVTVWWATHYTQRQIEGQARLRALLESIGGPDGA